MKFAVVLAFLVIVSFALANGSGPFKWTDCSGPDAVAVVHSAEITPKELKTTGGKVTLSVNYELLEPMRQGAYQKAVLKYFGMRVYQIKHDDLCYEAKRRLHESCPIPAGNVTSTASTTLPAGTPAGPYSAYIHGFNNDGKEMYCINGKFEIKL
eukprot:TRINITY_DN175335_c0_g1_i1.p2 TRINITY_DN175335_c0_g1~~TRINITY_DN175335_c0_g1_i1.p2  ORF type:complete len:154 (-),score=41.03 TRINITY_DN175335_c0_g1_i1:503-964(-)